MLSRQFKHTGWVAAVLALTLAGCMDDPAQTMAPEGSALESRTRAHGEHSHGRYFHLNWVPRPDVGQFAVEFSYPSAYRRSGYGICRQFVNGSFTTTPCSGGDGRPLPGDIILETVGATNLAFGDGTSTGILHYVVTSVNIADDWLFALALDPATGQPNIVHDYGAAGSFTATSITCCRIGGLRNPGSSYGVRTLVTTGISNRSPIGALPPIVSVAQGGIQTWLVPALDPDGDELRFSLTNPAGSIGGSQPIGMSIDPQTGVVSWDTNGRQLGLYWSNVTIEELRNGEVIGFVELDYMINLLTEVPDNDPPVFDAPAFCGGTTFASSGMPLSFPVTASDPNEGDVVTLIAVGVPAGATFQADDPDNPVSGEFNWTPAAGQGGTRIVTFIATDQNGAQALCNVTIDVDGGAPPPPVGVCPLQLTYPVMPNPGGTILWSAHERLLYVAIMATSNIPHPPYNAFQPNSVWIGPGCGGTATRAHPFIERRDVNGDGQTDAVVSFAIGHLFAGGNLNPATTEITLWGRLLDGQCVCGTAPIRMIGPGAAGR
jgi:hypothetical protein